MLNKRDYFAISAMRFKNFGFEKCQIGFYNVVVYLDPKIVIISWNLEFWQFFHYRFYTILTTLYTLL